MSRLNIKYLLLLALCGWALCGWSQQKGEGDTYRLIEAARNSLESQPALALLYIDSALVRSYEDRDSRAEGYCHLTLGQIQYQLGRFPLSLEHLTEAQQLFERTREEEGRYLVQKELGETLLRLQRWPEAQQAWQNYLAMARQRKNWKDVAEAENQLGNIEQAQSNYPAALQHFQTVLELSQANQEPERVISAYNNLAIACKDMGDTLMANLYSLQAGQVAMENGYFGKIVPVNDRKTATRSIDAPLTYTLTDKASSNDWLEKDNAALEATDGLALAYESQGKLDSALLNYKTARSLERQQLNGQISSLETALTENSQLNEQLQKVNWRIENRQSQLRRQQLISLALGMILLVMLASGIFVMRSYRARQRAHQQLALKSLRSQMNPHFIFNSLNSVNSFIAKNDARAANKYLADFSRLMRGVMENSEQEFIPLQTEIQILELYLGLEHLRFQDRFDYRFSVSPELDRDAIMIPPMLIQPYIENAIWHGLRYKQEKGFLQVELFPQGNALIVEIRDNGIGRKRSAELKTHNQNQQRSTGLKNTAARLELLNALYNQQLEITMDDLDPTQPDVGTLVRIRLSISENSLA